MTLGNTTNLELVTAEARDTLPEEITKDNFEIIDSYVAATRLTNGSGGSVIAGSVVVTGSADNTFTTTTTANNAKVVGVAQETILDAASGIVKHYGTTTVRVNATTAVGDWLVTSSSAGVASPVSGTNPPNGAFAIALSARTGAGTVTAMLLAVGITGTVQFPTSTNPTPTTDGTGEWDSNDNRLAIGDGASTKYFFPDNQGSDITAASTLTIGSDKLYYVNGTTTITGATSNPAGQEVILIFNSALTLTHGSSWLLAGGKSRRVAPGEITRFVSLGSGVWQEVTTADPGLKTLTTQFDMTSTTTLASVTQLDQDLAASATYVFEYVLPYVGSTSGDMKVGMAWTSAITQVNMKFEGPALTTGTWTTLAGNGGAVTTVGNATFEAAASPGSWVYIRGIVRTNAACTMSVQAAQNSSNGTPTSILVGAMCKVTRTS